MKKKILIVYTGGTIGMTRSENGYVPQLDSFIEQLHTIHELKDEKNAKMGFLCHGSLTGFFQHLR